MGSERALEMDIGSLNGVLMIGCGRMGGALLDGWLRSGLRPQAVWVEDPYPNERLARLLQEGGQVNASRPAHPSVVILAVKPQMMEAALAGLRDLPLGVPVLSIAAGISLARLEAALGARPVIRAMPNTPALVGRGLTALIGNDRASGAEIQLAEMLFAAVGECVSLATESDIDAVTAVSGSGPAYIFLLAEALEASARHLGLNAALARALARSTLAGSAELLIRSGREAAALRQEVTSPAGTTAAALAVLMRKEAGLTALMTEAILAARDRSVELGKEGPDAF